MILNAWTPSRSSCGLLSGQRAGVVRVSGISLTTAWKDNCFFLSAKLHLAGNQRTGILPSEMVQSPRVNIGRVNWLNSIFIRADWYLPWRFVDIDMTFPHRIRCAKICSWVQACGISYTMTSATAFWSLMICPVYILTLLFARG